MDATDSNLTTATVSPPPPARRWMRPAAAVILCCGAAWGVFAGIRHWQTYHLETVNKGVLYRTGNRSAREMENTVRACHPRVVISLLDDQEMSRDDQPQFRLEGPLLAKHGVRLVRIPVKLGGFPTDQDLQKFLSIMKDSSNWPVLIHCAQGVRRTGMFVAAYQRSILGWKKEQTKDEIQAFGHSGRTLKDIVQFIDLYDPATQSLMGTPVPSGRNVE